MSEEVSRRGFLSEGAGLGALAAGLLLGERQAAAAGEAQVVALSFSEHKDLAKVGGSAQATLPDKAKTEIIVAHPETDKFVCCQGRCTHANGVLAYDAKLKKFVCPDHGSRFELDGAVANGPAKKPLRSFDADQAVVVRGDKT